MNKKAQGLSVSFIILIVLGLVIVGILIFMIGGKVRQFGSSTNNCVEKKGTCDYTAQQCQGSIIGQMNCPEGRVCCVMFEEEPKAGGE